MHPWAVQIQAAVAISETKGGGVQSYLKPRKLTSGASHSYLQ